MSKLEFFITITGCENNFLIFFIVWNQHLSILENLMLHYKASKIKFIRANTLTLNRRKPLRYYEYPFDRYKRNESKIEAKFKLII